MTSPEAPDRLRALLDRPAPLFVYGTLLFAEVLDVLIGRMPAHEQASVAGWRAAALDGQVFPTLVPAAGRHALGRLLTDLDAREWAVLDDYEDDFYVLERVVTVDGRTAWTYAAPSDTPPAMPPVAGHDWNPDTFAHDHLTAYVSCVARLG